VMPNFERPTYTTTINIAIARSRLTGTVISSAYRLRIIGGSGIVPVELAGTAGHWA
jgi:hypothetical protein